MIPTMGIVDHTMGIVDFAPMVSSGRPEKKICLLCPVSGLKGAMKGHMKTHYVFVELLGDLAVFGEHDFTACQTANQTRGRLVHFGVKMVQIFTTMPTQ